MNNPFTKREDLLKCAAEYPDFYRDKDLQSERQLMALHEKVHKRRAPHITRSEPLDIAKWKWPGGAVAIHCVENTDDEVETISAVSFNQENEWLRIAGLTTLKGVGWPMASVILHFAHPQEKYPILDVRALTALGLSDQKYTGRFWVEYTNYCRNICEEFHVTIRELDQALWAKGANMAGRRKLTKVPRHPVEEHQTE